MDLLDVLDLHKASLPWILVCLDRLARECLVQREGVGLGGCCSGRSALAVDRKEYSYFLKPYFLILGVTDRVIIIFMMKFNLILLLNYFTNY